MTYRSKTKPFKHQAREFAQHSNEVARGLFWEPGTGKTKPIIDMTGKLYEAGEVDGLCVIAPNGVHRNWVSDEIPIHLSGSVAERTRCHIHYSTDTIIHKTSFNETLNHDGLAVLVMSYNAVWTDRGRKAWKAFLKKRRCVYVLDESHRVKNPNAKWSRRLLGSNTVAPYRRCLSGTPVDNSPFDLYNQLRFLDKDIWRDLGITTFGIFKQYFGIWEIRETSDEKKYPVCVAYRNLKILHEKLHMLGTRITKEDANLDLPPKLYSKRYVELSTTQKRLYKQLTDEYMLELEMGIITAPLAIVRLLRFQQIICGYLPKSDDDNTLHDIPGGNPRLDLLAEICNDLPHKTIIWARFRRDIQLISQHKSIKNRCEIADGSVTGPARSEALDRFQKRDVQFLVANPAAIGIGVTLHAAQTVIYYNNSFKLSERLQSEDRAHRIGLLHPVHYIDLVAAGTVDIRIIESLQRKVNLAAQITGDTLRDWI